MLCRARGGLGEAGIAFVRPSLQLEAPLALALVLPLGEAPGSPYLHLGEPKILVEVMLQDWSQRRARTWDKGLP